MISSKYLLDYGILPSNIKIIPQKVYFKHIKIMKKQIISFAILTLAFIMSCKKETLKTDGDISAINVLNNGSQFEIVYDTAHAKMQFSNGVYGRMGVGDFTVSGNNLNLYYYTTVPTQGVESKFYFRHSSNLVTKKVLAQPVNAGTFGTTDVGATYVYFPYTNILTAINKGGGNGYLRYFNVSNDVEMYFESSNNSLGTEDIAKRHFVCNPGLYPGWGFIYGTFSNWKTNSPFGVGAKFNMFYAPPATIQAGSYAGLNDVYRDASDKEHFLSFLIGTDSLYAIEYNYTDYGNSTTNPIYTTKTLAKLKITQTFPLTGLRLRHYSFDGKKISFGLQNLQTPMINTFTYNYETNDFTQNLSNAKLDYADTDSDIDLDDDGNVYYTGYASNGSNTNGVSIYKKSFSSAASIVGSDNFLKSGTINKLKYLEGRVYLVVISDQTGTPPVHQISVLRQK